MDRSNEDILQRFSKTVNLEELYEASNKTVQQLKNNIKSFSSEIQLKLESSCSEKYGATSSKVTALNNVIREIDGKMDKANEAIIENFGKMANLKNLHEAKNQTINDLKNDIKDVSLQIGMKFENFCAENLAATSSNFTNLKEEIHKKINKKINGVIVCPDKTWRKFENYCYHLLTDKTSMTGCRQDCVQLGGDLASIHSSDENEFVTSLIRDRPTRGGNKQTWIGGRYSKDQAKFYWFDQSDWDFDNWSLNEPHKSQEGWDCVFLGHDPTNLDKWVDGVCRYSSPTFDCICKI